GVAVAQLEDVADLDGPLDLQRPAAPDAALPRLDLPQVGPLADLDVAFDVDPAQVDVVDVGAGEHVPAAAQRLVGDDGQGGGQERVDGPEAAGQRAQRVLDLRRVGGADLGGAGRVHELLLVERVVAAQQDERERAVQDVHEGLDLPVVGRAVRAQVLDGADARRVEPLRRGRPGLVGDVRQ